MNAESTIALIYTPHGEHFGIVPCEAMIHEIPVVALKSGGVCETVISVPENNATGVLVGSNDPPTTKEEEIILINDMAQALWNLYLNKSEFNRHHLGLCGKERVKNLFGSETMVAELEKIFISLKDSPRQSVSNQLFNFSSFTFGIVFLVIIGLLQWMYAKNSSI